jgi:hypothetical protein
MERRCVKYAEVAIAVASAGEVRAVIGGADTLQG